MPWWIQEYNERIIWFSYLVFLVWATFCLFSDGQWRVIVVSFLTLCFVCHRSKISTCDRTLCLYRVEVRELLILVVFLTNKRKKWPAALGSSFFDFILNDSGGLFSPCLRGAAIWSRVMRFLFFFSCRGCKKTYFQRRGCEFYFDSFFFSFLCHIPVLSFCSFHSHSARVQGALVEHRSLKRKVFINRKSQEKHKMNYENKFIKKFPQIRLRTKMK